MWPDSPNAVPIGSFRSPVPLVGIRPDEGPLVTVCFNREWLPYVLGSLKQLLLQTTWATDDPAQLDLAQEQVFMLIDLFGNPQCPASSISIGAEGADENMIRQNPDNPCELQTSIDGTNWCTFADLSLCIPAGAQPGGGAPQPPPGGGEQCYNAQMAANNKWLLPTSVNSGDVITISDATGAGNDGTLSPWFCPNGQTFFLGACVGVPGSSGSDPLPSAPHLSLIVNIDGTFYEAFNTTITVPGGVTDGQVEFQINDSDLTDNAGSYQFKVCVTNNTPAAWTHIFDFTTTDGGWLVNPAETGASGVYTPGVGWTHANFSNGSHFYRGVDIIRDFSSRKITYIKVTFNVHGLSGAFGSTSRFDIVYNTTFEVDVTFADTTEGDGLTKDFSTAVAGVNHFRLFNVSSDTASGGETGSAAITRVEVHGEGTDPF